MYVKTANVGLCDNGHVITPGIMSIENPAQVDVLRSLVERD